MTQPVPHGTQLEKGLFFIHAPRTQHPTTLDHPCPGPLGGSSWTTSPPRLSLTTGPDGGKVSSEGNPIRCPH